MSDVTTELAMEASDKAMQIARLRAENAKLRESVGRLMTQRDERLARAEAENAKLRELCGFMLRCMKRNHHCDCCLVNGEHCEISYIESDARELGVDE